MSIYSQFVAKAKNTAKYSEVYQYNLKVAEERGYYGAQRSSLAEVITDGELFGMAELTYHDDSIEENDLPTKLWQEFDDAYVDWYEETY